MSSGLSAVQLMAKADQASLSARALLEIGDIEGACNRAYYAMFDAARAALREANAGEMAKTHSGVLTAFALHFVKNGSVPSEVGKMLKRAQEVRLIADYLGDAVELADAEALVDQAEIFVAEITKHIGLPSK